MVNTESMYGGMRREQARFFFDQGPLVNHFSYFNNPLTALEAGQLAEPARGEIQDPDFKPIGRGIGPSAAGSPAATSISKKFQRSKDHPARPLLPRRGSPGPSASDRCSRESWDRISAVGQDHVWMNMESIMLGGMARLEFEKEEVSATNVVAENYERLCQYLATAYEVEPSEPLARFGRSLRRPFGGANRAGQDETSDSHRGAFNGRISRANDDREKSRAVEKALRSRRDRLVMLGTPKRRELRDSTPALGRG